MPRPYNILTTTGRIIVDLDEIRAFIPDKHVPQIEMKGDGKRYNLYTKTAGGLLAAWADLIPGDEVPG